MSQIEPRIYIVESPYYTQVSDFLRAGAVAALEDKGLSYKVISVAGALEIPVAIRILNDKDPYSDRAVYIALGCVIRGETSHYDIVAGESARGLMDLGLRHGLCIGNGILTTETMDQAIVRADPAQKNKGADAVRAALELFNIKQTLAI